MPFKKGTSGNPAGRPKQNSDEKEQKEAFRTLLKASTVNALESIIAIANDKYNNRRFDACKYIIDKAYGSNIAFLSDDDANGSPLIIEIVSARKSEEDILEQEWREAELNGSLDYSDDD